MCIEVNVFTKEELNRFFQYCVALTGDETEAFDLLQDSLVKCLERGNNARSSKAYFRKFIRNLFIDHYRRETKHTMIEIEEKIIPVNENSLETVIANQEETRLILNDLNFKDRELLYLWAVEEYTAQELADFFDIPRGTILSRLHRLKIKIKTFLKVGYEKNAERK